PGGFFDWAGGDGSAYALLWHSPSCHRAVATRNHCAGGDHRAGGGAVDVGAERVVSRCARGDALRGAILDAGLTGGVSELTGASSLALALWPEPDDRSDLRL